MRLHCLNYDVGSGIVTVLFERMDPEILKAFLAIVGSCMSEYVYMDDGDSSFIAFGCFVGVVLFKNIDEGMLPLGDVLHVMVICLNYII